MPLMKWTEHYSVGVGEMDSQHQTIFDIINELFDSLRLGQESDALGIINRLIQYTQEHFAEEEAYLEASNSSDLGWQKEEHLKFTQRVEAYKQQLANGELLQVEAELSRFLMTWWNSHILQEDKKYDPRNA